MKNGPYRLGLFLSLLAAFAFLGQGAIYHACALAPSHSSQTDAELLAAAQEVLIHEKEALEKFVRRSPQKELLKEALEVRSLVLDIGRSAGLSGYQLLLLESASLAVEKFQFLRRLLSISWSRIFHDCLPK